MKSQIQLVYLNFLLDLNEQFLGSKFIDTNFKTMQEGSNSSQTTLFKKPFHYKIVYLFWLTPQSHYQ